jgi:hypothetical protein
MTKIIKITEEIKCDELTCTDNTSGDSCGYLNGDVDGYYCNCFFGTRLPTATETRQPLRCDKCKEAEQ